jgi:hypothetical protein
MIRCGVCKLQMSKQSPPPTWITKSPTTKDNAFNWCSMCEMRLKGAMSGAFWEEVRKIREDSHDFNASNN